MPIYYKPGKKINWKQVSRYKDKPISKIGKLYIDEPVFHSKDIIETQTKYIIDNFSKHIDGINNELKYVVRRNIAMALEKAYERIYEYPTTQKYGTSVAQALTIIQPKPNSRTYHMSSNFKTGLGTYLFTMGITVDPSKSKGNQKDFLKNAYYMEYGAGITTLDRPGKKKGNAYITTDDYVPLSMRKIYNPYRFLRSGKKSKYKGQIRKIKNSALTWKGEFWRYNIPDYNLDENPYRITNEKGEEMGLAVNSPPVKYLSCAYRFLCENVTEDYLRRINFVISNWDKEKHESLSLKRTIKKSKGKNK